jgi:hypothetical protein
MMHVDTDVFSGGPRSTRQLNHFVTVGKDRSGKVYLYDPYPREGTQIVYPDDPRFWTLFKNEDDDFKSTYIVSKTR